MIHSIARSPGHIRTHRVRGLVLGTAILALGAALAILPLPWAALGVIGIIGTGLLLINSRWALYLLVFAVPFGSLYEVNLDGITVGAAEALVVWVLVTWLARSVALQSDHCEVNRCWTFWPKLSIPLLVFIGAVLFSVVNATTLPFFLKEIAKWVEFLGILLFVANKVTAAQSRTILATLLLAGTAQAAVGAYQFVTQSGPEFFVLMGRFMRAYGTFEQPNPYAGYLGLIAPLAFSLATAPRGAFSGRRVWLRWLAAVSFGAIIIAMGMSWSRGGWLAAVAALAVASLARSRKGAVLFLSLVAFVALGGLIGSFELLPDSVIQRVTSFVPFADIRDVPGAEITDENYAVLERLAHWQAAIDMWRDHPWLGVGFGNYEAAYARYALPKWDLPLGHAHNYYLNIAAETGLLGLLAYLAFWGAAFWEILQTIRHSDHPYSRAIALGALGILTHVSTHNLLDNLWVHNLYVHLAIILGLALSQARTRLTTSTYSQSASSLHQHAASKHG